MYASGIAPRYRLKTSSYACVIGRAKVTTDAKLKAKLWRKEWAQHFPGGKTDPNYVAMLAAIEAGRKALLAKPRVDMPGAKPIAQQRDFGKTY